MFACFLVSTVMGIARVRPTPRAWPAAEKAASPPEGHTEVSEVRHGPTLPSNSLVELLHVGLLTEPEEAQDDGLLVEAISEHEVAAVTPFGAVDDTHTDTKKVDLAAKADVTTELTEEINHIEANMATNLAVGKDIVKEDIRILEHWIIPNFIFTKMSPEMCEAIMRNDIYFALLTFALMAATVVFIVRWAESVTYAGVKERMAEEEAAQFLDEEARSRNAVN